MSSFREKLSYVPLRLTEEERLLLQVLEQTLDVSEYTDHVDVTFSHTRKNKFTRILESLMEIFSTMSGLLLAVNLTKGEKVVAGKDLKNNYPIFKDIFEVGRRYKIMNPTKMRNTYGKLIHILMDTESDMIRRELQYSFYKSILTVTLFLESKGIEEMLDDELLEVASRKVDSLNEYGEPKAQHAIQSQVQEKKAALEELIKKYSCPSKVSAEDIMRVVDSINDTYSYTTFNVKPVKDALDLLKNTFDPRDDTPTCSQDIHNSLALSGSRGSSNSYSNKYWNSLSGYSSRFFGGGSCLNHDHATQFTFVKQSLTLWLNIMRQLPRLWYLADLDMTQQPYHLADTGQGYMRVQSCPRVAEAMRSILGMVQRSCSEGWVGLSVIHLGDRDVPNALVFIDKYVQVPRILAPIVQCVNTIEKIAEEDSNFHQYVRREWDSVTLLKKQILSDFFKHGFDGSGDDGGSCIDGRLTSAWNWCSKIFKKPYYYVFMFTGFQGFDGDFK